jgi:hypothetical protein
MFRPDVGDIIWRTDGVLATGGAFTLWLIVWCDPARRPARRR